MQSSSSSQAAENSRIQIERLLISSSTSNNSNKNEAVKKNGNEKQQQLLMVDHRQQNNDTNRNNTSNNDESKNVSRNGTATALSHTTTNNNDAVATLLNEERQVLVSRNENDSALSSNSTHAAEFESTSTKLLTNNNSSTLVSAAAVTSTAAGAATAAASSSTSAIPTAKKKARTMFPLQQKNYGPKATLKKVTDDYLLLVQDPLSQQLSWTKPPLHVLVLKKIGNALIQPFNEILKFLIYDHNLIVYVEENDYENEIFRLDDQIRAAMLPRGNQLKPSLRKFCQSSPNYSCRTTGNTDVDKIDLVVCLGGDGTLLHASGLFQKSCPPVLSIHMGSLGFLCPFDFDDYREYMNCVIKGGVPLLLRNRIKFKLEKSLPVSQSSPQTTTTMSPNGSAGEDNDDGDAVVENIIENDLDEDYLASGGSSSELIALNEVVISRGPSPYLSNLDLYINDYLMTTVQGDGLIISTPTGSTAYAMAAGASMCHPSVQSIIIAPICPHSLSFRPIVVPAGVELKIAINDDSRHPSAWYSVDGRNTAELRQGYHISITASEFPVPSICRTDQVSDWFEGLATCLHWNQRQKQLPANACYLRDSRGQSLCSPQSNSLLYSSLSSKSSSTSSLKINTTNTTITTNNNNNNHTTPQHQSNAHLTNNNKSITESSNDELVKSPAKTNGSSSRNAINRPLADFTLETADDVVI